MSESTNVSDGTGSILTIQDLANSLSNLPYEAYSDRRKVLMSIKKECDLCRKNILDLKKQDAENKKALKLKHKVSKEIGDK